MENSKGILNNNKINQNNENLENGYSRNMRNGYCRNLTYSDEVNVEKNLSELSTKIEEIKKIKRAIKGRKMENLKMRFSKSGEVYKDKKMALYGLKFNFEEDIKCLNDRYNFLYESLLRERSNLEKGLEYDRAVLTCERGDLTELRKMTEVQMYERIRDTYKKNIERLQIELSKKNVCADKKYLINQRLEEIKKQLKKNKECFYNTNIGKEYFRRTQIINNQIIKIKEKKEKLESNKLEELEINDEYNRVYYECLNEYKQHRKFATFKNKQPGLMNFIGAVKYKLGIGRYKQDNNIADLIKESVSNIKKIYNNRLKRSFIDISEKIKRNCGTEILKNHINHRSKEKVDGQKEQKIMGTTERVIN